MKRPSRVLSPQPFQWKAEPLASFDRVRAVAQDAVEAAMDVRDVIAAVKVVVDEHLPVAVDGVLAPLHPVQIAEAERRQLLQQLESKILLQ